jgi:hypothetical protein
MNRRTLLSAAVAATLIALPFPAIAETKPEIR